MAGGNDSKTNAPVISYETPVDMIRHENLLAAAKFFGIFPLITGTLVFLGFLFVHSDILLLFGAFTVFFGTVLVAIGLICIAVYFFTNRFERVELRHKVHRETFISVFLLLANFPTAIVYIGISTYFIPHSH